MQDFKVSTQDLSLDTCNRRGGAGLGARKRSSPMMFSTGLGVVPMAVLQRRWSTLLPARQPHVSLI